MFDLILPGALSRFPPTSSAEKAEFGLWLTHQLDIDVALIYGDGFTVRLCSGAITG